VYSGDPPQYPYQQGPPPPPRDTQYQQYQLQPSQEYPQRIVRHQQDLQEEEEEDLAEGDGRSAERATTSFSVPEAPQKPIESRSFSVTARRNTGGPFSLKRATSFSLGKGTSLNFRRQSSFSLGRRGSTIFKMRKSGGNSGGSSGGNYSHVTPSLVPSESPSKMSPPVGYIPKGK